MAGTFKDTGRASKKTAGTCNTKYKYRPCNKLYAWLNNIEWLPAMIAGSLCHCGFYCRIQVIWNWFVPFTILELVYEFCLGEFRFKIQYQYLIHLDSEIQPVMADVDDMITDCKRDKRVPAVRQMAGTFNINRPFRQAVATGDYRRLAGICGSPTFFPDGGQSTFGPLDTNFFHCFSPNKLFKNALCGGIDTPADIYFPPTNENRISHYIYAS